MKKKTMVLGGLIAAVAITGYSVSGTYAKYVSSVEATDTARVAIWNLNELTEINLFSSSYKKPNATATSLYDDNIIAPGTSGSYTFKIEGSFEPNVAISAQIIEEDSHSIEHKLSTTGKKYDPIVYKLKDENGNSLTSNNKGAEDGWTNYAGLVTAINKNNKINAAGTYTLEWKWEFEAGANEPLTNQTDDKDTVLGNDLAQAIITSPTLSGYINKIKSNSDKLAKAEPDAPNIPTLEAAIANNKANLKKALEAGTDIEEYMVKLVIKVTATQTK